MIIDFFLRFVYHKINWFNNERVLKLLKKEKGNDYETLKEELLNQKKNGCLKIDAKQINLSDKFSEGYKDFLDKAKTEREAVRESIKLAKKAGFKEFTRGEKYKAGDKVYYNNRNKALTLAIIGKNGTKDGVKLAIAHIDSPRLDLKPNPLYESDNNALFKTHYYGGIKKYQWTAIPLALHGIIVTKSGKTIEVNIGENQNEPCFCVTDLLPHLAKEQMSKPMQKSILGENLNVLVGSRPF